jgi:hypothetical protein
MSKSSTLSGFVLGVAASLTSLIIFNKIISKRFKL